jgi:mannose-1-phosphate guanylyltransferase
MIVTPSDHLITRENDFCQSVVKGFDFVERNDALLTMGIKPSRPETGYGYIQVGRQVEPGIQKVKTFTEKPNLELAKVFLETGEFFWNSGIFIWSAASIKKAMTELTPDIAGIFEKGSAVFNTPAETAFIEANFPGCMGLSIDFAVMEKASNVYVECVDFGWNDLGTWSALYDN